jgi:hypothetical protein
MKQHDHSVDNKSLYNADALIHYSRHNNLEVLLHETGYEYGNVDKTKYAMDNLKAMFGLLSMIKIAADTYRHATRTTFLGLKLYFVQAYNLKLYLWSLILGPSDDFIMLLEDKVLVPYKFNKKDTELFEFLSFMTSPSVLNTAVVFNKIFIIIFLFTFSHLKSTCIYLTHLSFQFIHQIYNEDTLTPPIEYSYFGLLQTV